MPVIGDRWTKIINEQADSEHDFVRIEIEQALQTDIPILPVLVENSRFPSSSELPDSIKDFALINASTVRTGKDFNNDVALLAMHIKGKYLSRASITQKIRYHVSKIKYHYWGLALLAAIMMYLLVGKCDSNPICDVSRVSTIIAPFDENDDDGLANTILAYLDQDLPDSSHTNTLSAYQPRDIDRYHDYIENQYFKDKCDTTGLFVNGYMDEEKKLCNIYATNIGLEIKHPDYLNKKKIVLINPSKIKFSTYQDAEFIANFIKLLVLDDSISQTNKIEDSYKLQERFNITKESEKSLGNESVLSYIYLVRANSYAIEGNDKRAKQFYDAAIAVGNPEVTLVAKSNKTQVQPIVNIMYADDELRALRASNIRKHERIESKFEKFLKDLGKALKKFFDSFKRR